MAPPVVSAIQAFGAVNRLGSARKPRISKNGRATNPVSRSSTTDANATSRAPMSRAVRVTRSTSPPTVDGSTLPTNWPAK